MSVYHPERDQVLQYITLETVAMETLKTYRHSLRTYERERR